MICIGSCEAILVHPENCKFHTWKDHTTFDPHLEILRKRNHFIFTVETTGVLHPKDVLLQSINILKARAMSILASLPSDSSEDEHESEIDGPSVQTSQSALKRKIHNVSMVDTFL